MTLLAHTLPHLVQIIPLTTKLQLSPYQDHQIPTHNKREREVDIISGTLPYLQNMPTSSLIYQRDKSETQIKIWEWCCIRSYHPYTYTESFPQGSWKKEKRDFQRGTVAILVLAASYLKKSIKNPHPHHYLFTSVNIAGLQEMDLANRVYILDETTCILH